ncbi:hypothetical protein LINGRAHAP2_LOCUS5141 [Linum grandiflorum]
MTHRKGFIVRGRLFKRTPLESRRRDDSKNTKWSLIGARMKELWPKEVGTERRAK